MCAGGSVGVCGADFMTAAVTAAACWPADAWAGVLGVSDPEGVAAFGVTASATAAASGGVGAA